MFQFNIVENSKTRERAYYVNSVRFDRAFWRECMEREIKVTEVAMEFQNQLIAQLDHALRATQAHMDKKATFQIDDEGREVYRDVARVIRTEIREAKYTLEEGQEYIENLKEKLED